MLFDQIASNKRKTWILLLVFFLLLALVGYAVGYLFIRSGLGGLVIALIIGFIYALSMIFQSTEIVMSMNGAREVDEQTAPDLYHVVEDMALVARFLCPVFSSLMIQP
ncbi:heat shock protein HtpX [Streptococcus pneumoniae 801]|nr:heat shock protein HtpX [Streptococcus pneumoniae 801]